MLRMELVPVENMVRAVEGHPDLVAFRQDFVLEGKAVGDQTVTEQENGDLVIEGYAAVFEGLDREGENFVEGAFSRGIKSFLSGQAALCFHHKNDMPIGKVTDLEEHEGKGLWMRARVDKQETSSPLHYIYNGIKKGTINGLSVGGFFKRAVVAGRQMIADMDFTEISTTAVPVHPGTNFAVVAGKALTADIQVPDNVGAVKIPEGEVREEDFMVIQEAVVMLGRIFDNVERRGTTNTTTTTLI